MSPARHASIPQARTANLVVKPVAGEVLVYDLERHRAHNLTATAAAVWRHCDGRRTVPEIARAVAEDTGTSGDEQLVATALAQLARARLLEAPGAWAGVSRREALRAGLATAAAVPLVTTIVAPRAAQAQSLTCTVDATLCTGSCGAGNSCTGLSEACCAVVTGGTCCAVVT